MIVLGLEAAFVRSNVDQGGSIISEGATMMASSSTNDLTRATSKGMSTDKRHSLTIITFTAIVMAATTASPLIAQRPPAVSGVVRDDGGRPIENVLVVLDARSDRRITRTDSIGRFSFERVGAGSHELATAYLRFITDIRTIDVGSNGAEIEITLKRNTALLDTVHVLTQRTGVHGLVIAHEDISPLAGADVQLLGANVRAKTGADGRFDFSSVKPGGYVVYITRRGYQARMFSVVVQRDSAVDLALNMDPSTADTEKRFAVVLGEFNQRRTWANRGNAALIPRQELSGHTGQQLSDALRYSMSFLIKGLIVDDSTCVYINGVFQPSLAVRDVSADNIEAVEVYGSGADFTGTVTYRNGERPSRLPPRAICGFGSPRSETSMGLEEQVRRSLGPGGKSALPGARNDPARVEAVVIWLKR